MKHLDSWLIATLFQPIANAVGRSISPYGLAALAAVLPLLTTLVWLTADPVPLWQRALLLAGVWFTSAFLILRNLRLDRTARTGGPDRVGWACLSVSAPDHFPPTGRSWAGAFFNLLFFVLAFWNVVVWATGVPLPSTAVATTMVTFGVWMSLGFTACRVPDTWTPERPA